MKMSTNGKRLAFAIIGTIVAAAVVVSQINSAKKLKSKKNDPTIGQYLNRLVEFFGPEELDRAQDEFLNMVDFGMYPREAFSIIVFNGELN